jgi:branched-chain amino acid transport system substrate-binding protein
MGVKDMAIITRRSFLATTAAGAATATFTSQPLFAQEADVVFGAVLPLTGASASIGEDQRRGVELAVEKINADGGVLGKPLNVVIEDSAGNAQGALNAAKKLVSVDGAKVVLGEYSSGITVPLREALAHEGVVHVNVGSSSVSLRQKGGGTAFSVIGLDDLMARFVAKALHDKGLSKAAVVLPNNSYGESLNGQFATAFKEAGGAVVQTLLYTEGQSSYRRELQQVARFQPDVYLYSAYGQEAAIINREAFELGQKKTPWYGIYLTMCISDSLKETVEGQFGAEVNFIGKDSAWYQEAYTKKYGESFRSAFNGYLYDGVAMAAAAINKANSTDPDAMLQAARSLEFHGATGLIKLDGDNERAVQDYLNVIVKDGAVVPVPV